MVRNQVVQIPGNHFFVLVAVEDDLVHLPRLKAVEMGQRQIVRVVANEVNQLLVDSLIVLVAVEFVEALELVVDSFLQAGLRQNRLTCPAHLEIHLTSHVEIVCV
jgi:hypothetical protein